MATPTKPPVLLVHGLWLHANSWQPWIERLAAAGYQAFAPGWPGEPDTVEAARKDPRAVAGYGIDAVVDHYASNIAALPAQPIVIGHSFGGVIAQRLLGQDLAAAAVGLDAAPIKGVLNLPVSSLRVASIALRDPRNRNRAVALTRDQFRYGFGNALPQAESDRLYDTWAIPSPGRPLFEAAFAAFSPKSPANVATRNARRGPLLLSAGGKDHTVPASISHATARLYRHAPTVTDVIDFPDRGHSLGIDAGWPEVADAVIGWLGKQGL
jgi:non-heme chloroperoxidase